MLHSMAPSTNAPTGGIPGGIQPATRVHDYASFLRRHDPVDPWEEVVPHAAPLGRSVAPGCYNVPADVLDRLGAKVPGLRDLLATEAFADHSAPRLGLRHASTRMQQHALMPEATERIAGLGLDVSPVALDAAAALA